MIDERVKYDNRYRAIVADANNASFNLAELQAWAAKRGKSLSFDWLASDDATALEDCFYPFATLSWAMADRLERFNPGKTTKHINRVVYDSVLLCAVFDGDLTLYRTDNLEKIDVEGARRKYDRDPESFLYAPDSAVVNGEAAQASTPNENVGDIGKSRPPSQQRHQEQEILRVIGELGYTATGLPKIKQGKSGVKAEVRGKLKYSVKVFDLAWQRLRDSKEIKNQE